MTDKPKKFTIQQAIINVCNRYEPGQTVIAWNIYNDVMAELKRHEYKGQPLQETVARIYRMTASACDMETLPGKGQYKKISVHLTDEEKKLGQQALFC